VPKREDIKKILVVGSGSIVIGQGCEFDYSGTQGLKALREEGYETVLINSNPATIMTDPEIADRTYIEPLTPEFLDKVLAAEKPQAILPTLGGQTALNLTVAAAERGILKKHGVEILGARLDVIRKAEDRQLFKAAMQKIGLDLPRSVIVSGESDLKRVARELGFPIIVRASFTLGGAGGGIAYHFEELRARVHTALEMSPVKKVQLDESIIGWKEYELEVMRDRADNFVVVCAIENVDPMGVHTGDSITVAPSQTLTDRQYQGMRDDAKRIVSEIGVETGGCNIQFAVNPRDGRRVVIEINPRVSRSSALASKATGFPIAKLAAKLAVGYALDELANDITKATPASFEPAIDYVVVKAPRFATEKFGELPLDTAMKSVGETMAIGRTFKEALQKALRGLESGKDGLDDVPGGDAEILLQRVATPSSTRLHHVKTALSSGVPVERIAEISRIDPWFLGQMKEIADFERALASADLDAETLREAKSLGFSDAQIARAKGLEESAVRARRRRLGVRPSYKLVDTCAGEFPSRTPYFYSTYDAESDDLGAEKPAKKVMILGSGPNRIGQGIEFDYCCVQASKALREAGWRSVMVNCNPETVSTDYDASDRLYFEPLTLEDVLEIVDREKPDGVIVQFGGQTPLNLAVALEKAGVPILGTKPTDIDVAEDRRRFGAALKKLKILSPESGIAKTPGAALKIARRIGYPVMVRPSYVLGGRAMEIVYDDRALSDYVERARRASKHPSILIDRFLADAAELDVDAVCDGRDVWIAGVMEHIEEAGVHSGDSACTLPPHSLAPSIIETIREHTRRLALQLKVRGLVNIQYAVKDGAVYVLEANPRASRTVPFVSKAAGLPVARIATWVMMGRPLKKLVPAAALKGAVPPYAATKEAVLPFIKFPGVDPRLGPEMKSTGEVMGLDADFPRSFAKSQQAAGLTLPTSGGVFISVRDEDKPEILHVARALRQMGFTLVATRNTADFLSRHGLPAERVAKIGEGKPDVVDLLKQRTLSLVINTPSGKRSRADGYQIRRTALELDTPCITNIRSVNAAVHAISVLQGASMGVSALQDRYRSLPYSVKVGLKA
jgi:carbamoyl-phosphate synthase large subunit